MLNSFTTMTDESDWPYVDKFLKLGVARALTLKDPFSNEELCSNVKSTGMYILLVLHTREVYVGSSVDLYRRKVSHIAMLRNKNHTNPRLRQLSMKDEPVRFLFMTFFTDSEEKAIALEQKIITKYQNNPRLLNVAMDATTPRKGHVCSKEERQKLREARSSLVVKERYSIASKRAWQNPVTRLNLLAANQAKGRPVEIDGISYPSISEAAKALSLNKETIRFRLNSRHFTTWKRSS